MRRRHALRTASPGLDGTTRYDSRPIRIYLYLKQMLAQLLEGKKKPKAKTSSKKSKGKKKEGESSSSIHTGEDEQSNSESSKSPSEEGGNSENGSTHYKRMNKLEQCLKALTNRKGLQEAEVVRPFPAE